MFERERIYRVPGPREARAAVLALDSWPEDKLIGLGIYAKGFEGNPELFYVYTKARDLTPAEELKLEDTADAFGDLTKLSFRSLMAPPTPHFIATGVAENIVIALEERYPAAKLGN